MEPTVVRPVPELRRALVAAALLAFFSGPARAEEGSLRLIPYPSSVQRLEGSFEARAGMRVVVSQPANPELHRLGELAAEILRQRFGLRPMLVPEGAGARLGLGTLRLTLTALPRGASPESYVLELGHDDIALSASSTAGLFYGLQTLRQIFGGEAPIPSLRIEDTPRFAHRGLYLDVDREALPVSRLEGWIDLAARYKLNTLHWRLAGPDVWRLEVLRYPRLGEAPAQVYSQEEARRIIAFASARYVTIVPEVDVSRQSRMAAQAYPDLACGDGPCPSARAQQFAAEVLTEIGELFPARTVDLGDESADSTVAEREARQNLARWLGERGRRPAGMANAAGAVPGLVFRRGPVTAADEAPAGTEVVIAVEGATPGALFGFEMIPAGATGEWTTRVVGGEAELEPGSAAAPSLAALAEALWTAAERRDLAAFEARWRDRHGDQALDGEGLASSPLSPP